MNKAEKARLLVKLKAVQKEVGVKSATLKQLIADMSRDPRMRFRTSFKVARIRYLREVEGRTLTDIATEMGCTRFTIREILGPGK